MTAPPADVVSILAEGRQAHIAIETSNGPHVTPQLYAWSDNRLWFAAASTTRKAAVLEDGSRAAAVVSTSGRSVLLAGRIAVLDPRNPAQVLRRLGNMPEAVRASLGFAARNAADLAGFARDSLRGRLGWRLPPTRIVFSLAPDRMAKVESDLVVWTKGWSKPTKAQMAMTDEGGAVPAVLALPGPVAVPARWNEHDDLVSVAPGLATMLGVHDHHGPVAVVVDHYNGPGPAAKEGTLLHGEASPLGDGRYLLDTERVVAWQGVQSDSRATR